MCRTMHITAVAGLLALTCSSLLFSSLSISSVQAQEATEFTSESLDFFEKDVRPILASRCYGCHSERVTEAKANLKVDSRQGILDGGDSGSAFDAENHTESLIAKAVRYEDGMGMPPDEPLPSSEQAILLKWIEQGLPWPKESGAKGEFDLQARMKEHWIWKRASEVPVPKIANPSWARNAVDAFVMQGLEKAGIEPASEAEKVALARRVAIDLTGLAIEPALLQSYLADSSPDAYEHLVENLLASPRFGERWGRHWLDVVRYGETYGHEFDYSIPEAYRYRDYVVKSLNDDIGYDQFVREHLMGDMLEQPRTDAASGENLSCQATSVWWLAQCVHAPVDILGDRATRVDDQVDTFSKALLGLTVACARCHDHKFDAISAADYYRLTGMFLSSRREITWLDPKHVGSDHRNQVAKLLYQGEKLWAEQPTSIGAKKTRYYQPGQSKDSLEHPAYLLDKLQNLDPAIPFVEQWNKAVEPIKNLEASWLEWERSSPVISQRTKGRAFWKLDGAAWGAEDLSEVAMRSHLARDLNNDDLLTVPKLDWFTSGQPRAIGAEHIASARYGRKMQGAARSQNFNLTHPVIVYRMRGKGVTLAASVEHYYMNVFTGLLFGDTRKGVDTGDKWQWVTQGGDLRKYIDRSVYLEVLDEGEGWFEIDEVRLTDRAPPARPSSMSRSWLDRTPSSYDELLRWYDERVAQAAELALQGKGSSDDTEILDAIPNWLTLSQADWKVEPLSAWGNTLNESQQIDQRAPFLPRCLVTSEGTGGDEPIQLRGNPRTLGDRVVRGDLSATSGLDRQEPVDSGRRSVANALLRPDHPLTSRVIVNRIWMHLFGAGLVDSPDNLGVLGGKPTHPELLDYLSLEMQKKDWSIKQMVRFLVTSQTYRMSSQGNEKSLQIDPNNKLLSRMPARRLSGETLRDRLLQLAGGLDLKMYGPSVPTYVTAEMQGRGRPGASGPIDGAGRRSVYLEVRRNFLNPLLVSFDLPSPQSPQGKRNQSNVPAQALSLLNDPLVLSQAKLWSERLLKEADIDQRIDRLYWESLGRAPSVAEMELIKQFLASQENEPDAWFDLCHTMINSKEFWFLR